jgi:hypothetical protein
MKQILDLLNQLDKKSDELWYINLFGDFSGCIVYDNGKQEIAFNDKQDCIKELKQLLNDK